jgi:hypothetical protein
MRNVKDGRAATSSVIESGMILLHLSRAVQRASRYNAEHPSMALAVSSLMSALEAEWKLKPFVAVGVAHDRLSLGDREIDARHGVLAWLVKKLSSRGLASLVFSQRASTADLVSLAAWLGAGAEQSPAPRLKGIALIWTDESRGRLSEGKAPDAVSSGDPLNAWRTVVERLTKDWFQGDAGALSDDPEELAAALSATIERNEGVGFATLTSRVITAGLGLPGLPHDARRVVRPRLAAFVSHLSPDLRRELLRVDARTSGEKLRFLAELADALPDTTLMEVLADVDEAGRRVRFEFVVLLEKLVGLSVRDPFLRELTETKLISFGLPRGMTLMESSRVRQILEKTLRPRSDRERNKTESRALIENVDRRLLEGEPRSRVYVDETPDEIRSHVSSILLRLLVRLPEHPDAPRYIERLRDELPRDLEQGRFAALFEIASSLDDLGRLRLYLPEELPPLIDGYFKDLRGPGAVERLMSAIEAGGENVADELAKLFVLIGVEAGLAALDRIAALAQESDRDRFVRLLIRLPPEKFADMAARARLSGGSARRAMIEILALPEAPLRLELALPFLRDRDSQVRLAAMRILALGDDRPEQISRFLDQGLRDADDDIRRIALDIAPQRLGDRLVGFLAGYLRSRPSGRNDLTHRRRAIAMIEDCGAPQARAALGDVLLANRYVLRPGRVRLAQSLAAALARLGGDDAEKAVNLWSRSPTGRVVRALRLLEKRR